MPARIIRDRILSSESLARLSHPAERLFYRLIVLVDDHGRFHGSPQYVRHSAMAMLKVSIADVARWMGELSEANIVCLYSVDNRPYLQLTNWLRHQRLRAKTSKYPEHAGCKCCQVTADDSKCAQMLPGTGNGIGIGLKDGAAAPPKAPAIPGSTEDLIWNGGLAYLVDHGVKESSARPLLGRLRKDHGDKALAAAIGRMLVERPSAPAGWLMKAVTTTKRTNGSGGKLRTRDGIILDVRPGTRIEYVDRPDATDHYTLPNGTLSVAIGAQWVTHG